MLPADDALADPASCSSGGADSTRGGPKVGERSWARSPPAALPLLTDPRRQAQRLRNQIYSDAADEGEVQVKRADPSQELAGTAVPAESQHLLRLRPCRSTMDCSSRTVAG